MSVSASLPAAVVLVLVLVLVLVVLHHRKLPAGWIVASFGLAAEPVAVTFQSHLQAGRAPAREIRIVKSWTALRTSLSADWSRWTMKEDP